MLRQCTSGLFHWKKKTAEGRCQSEEALDYRKEILESRQLIRSIFHDLKKMRQCQAGMHLDKDNLAMHTSDQTKTTV